MSNPNSAYLRNCCPAQVVTTTQTADPHPSTCTRLGGGWKNDDNTAHCWPQLDVLLSKVSTQWPTSSRPTNCPLVCKLFKRTFSGCLPLIFLRRIRLVWENWPPAGIARFLKQLASSSCPRLKEENKRPQRNIIRSDWRAVGEPHLFAIRHPGPLYFP